jgi:plastocyanin
VRRSAGPGLVVLALLMGTLGAAGCGSDGDDPGDAADTTATTRPGPTVPADVVDVTGAATVEIAVVDNDFEPAAFRVDPGTEIVFANGGETRHNVTPVDEGAFIGIDEGELGPGSSASVVIDEAGTYFYYCSLPGSPTGGQNGVIVVGA